MSRYPEIINELAQDIHHGNVDAGWWDDHLDYGGNVPDAYFIPAKLALAHSEISEGLEGHRKGLKDDHLPQFDMLDVEIGDAIIRLLDIAGKRGAPIGDIIAAKRAYNAQRADHKREARAAQGGKAI